MDANKTHREKRKRKEHKYAVISLDHIFEVIPYKIADVRPPIPISQTILLRNTNKTCRVLQKSKDELACNVLLWTPSLGRISFSRPAKTYIHQLGVYTRCRLENRPRPISDTAGWRERKSQGTPSFQRDLIILSQGKLVTLVEGEPKPPFSIATTPRCRGGCYSSSGLDPLYPYLIMLRVKQSDNSTILVSLVWLDLGLNSGLLDFWRTIYSLGQWPG